VINVELNSTPVSLIVAEPDLELFFIFETFKKTYQTLGPDSWSPFFVFFQDPFTKTAVCQSRKIISPEEAITCVSEISYLTSTIPSYANILTLDFASEPEEFYYKNDLHICSNYLKVFFYSKSSIIALNAPYIIIDNEPIFLSDNFIIEEELSIDDEILSSIVSILHTHSFSKTSEISAHHVLSYLTSRGHYPAIINPEFKINPYLNYSDESDYIEISNHLNLQDSFSYE